MADNAQVTTGVLETSLWAADEISSTKYQRVKVSVGPDGTATADLAGRAIGTDGVINVDPRRKMVRVTDASSGLTTASTTYTAGDQVGALQSISSALRTGALTGTVTGAVIVDAADVCPTTAGYDIYIWESDPTLASDNAAGPGVSDADMLKLVGKIEMPAFRDEGGNRVSTWTGALDVLSSDTSLRYSYVTRGDHSFFAAATDLQLTLTIVQD